MQREIQLTADGSHTIAVPEMGVTYHSHHGAIGESLHVYIQAGLQPLLNKIPGNQPIHLLEMGFGTGLNALLSLQEAIQNQHPVHYTAVELYPLSAAEAEKINHGNLLSMEESFLQMHRCNWEEDIELHPCFVLHKTKIPIQEIAVANHFHCIYFDAFSPTVQPELWTQAVFEKLYRSLMPSGKLLTYCSKTVVRKAMGAAGFSVAKIPGPWGKREMVIAEKPELD